MDRVDQQPEHEPGSGRTTGGPAADGVEELGQGPERRPSPAAGWAGSRWRAAGTGARSVVAVLAGVALGAVVVLGFQNVHGQRPTPTHSARPSLPVSAILVAQDICTTFEGSVLQVSFRIQNAGQTPVSVVGVRPDLPLGMLLTLGTVLTPSACAGGPPGPADGLLNPGTSQPVTFRLLPLDVCPQAAPVAAAVDVANSTPATVSVPVLVDLGSVRFASCPTQPASQ
jgi:hypothetical protein